MNIRKTLVPAAICFGSLAGMTVLSCELKLVLPQLSSGHRHLSLC